MEAAIHRVFIQGGLYVLGRIVLQALAVLMFYSPGAVLYACRIPERFLPGKCDFWFQSHQIFHILVIAAAFVHLHGMQNMALYRLTQAGACHHHIDQAGDFSVSREDFNYSATEL